MKCLERNKMKFYYALFQEQLPVEDEYGNDTGEYLIKYSVPVEMFANVSAAAGGVQQEQFGSAIRYDRVILSDETNCPIDEHSVLCVDSPPSYDADGNLIFDYVITKVAKSLNTISYAITKVSTS